MEILNLAQAHQAEQRAFTPIVDAIPLLRDCALLVAEYLYREMPRLDATPLGDETPLSGHWLDLGEGPHREFIYFPLDRGIRFVSPDCYFVCPGWPDREGAKCVNSRGETISRPRLSVRVDAKDDVKDGGKDEEACNIKWNLLLMESFDPLSVPRNFAGSVAAFSFSTPAEKELAQDWAVVEEHPWVCMLCMESGLVLWDGRDNTPLWLRHWRFHSPTSVSMAYDPVRRKLFTVAAYKDGLTTFVTTLTFGDAKPQAMINFSLGTQLENVGKVVIKHHKGTNLLFTNIGDMYEWKWDSSSSTRGDWKLARTASFFHQTTASTSASTPTPTPAPTLANPGRRQTKRKAESIND